MNKKITFIRLQKEQQSMKKQPISQVLISRTETFTFHFCLYGLEQDFEGGFYHGILELAHDYPFSPPKIKFITENGRFQVNKHICTTFTHYHRQTWSSSWNIRTILTGLISFIYSDQKGIGGVFFTPAKRKALAKKSLKNNLADDKFLQLFKEQIIENKLKTKEELQHMMEKKKKPKGKEETKEEATVVAKETQIDEKINPELLSLDLVKIGSEIKLQPIPINEENELNEQEMIESLDKRRKLIHPFEEITARGQDKNVSEDEQI